MLAMAAILPVIMDDRGVRAGIGFPLYIENSGPSLSQVKLSNTKLSKGQYNNANNRWT